MTKINHDRPNLRLFDNLRRELKREPAIIKHLSIKPSDKKAISTFQSPPPPSQDARLSQANALALESVLSIFHDYLPARGLVSGLIGKPTKKQLANFFEVEARLVECGVQFWRQCASTRGGDGMNPFLWLQEFVSAHHSAVYEWLAENLLNQCLEQYFSWVLNVANENEREDFIVFCTERLSRA